MCVVDMSNNPPPSSSRAKDFFPSPALSLSLAGIFRHGGLAAEGEGASTSNMEVEEGEEGSTVGGDQRVEEISSEYSGPTRSKSEDEFEGDEDDEGGGDGDNKQKKKKRKKYHRHTAEQIRVMEALFKESPHPDEKQRQQLSKQLGLAPRQVKFWFQNRRTQIKVEKLRAALGKHASGTMSPSCSTSHDQENIKSSLDFYTGIFGLDESRIMDIVNQAMDELIKMATMDEPLWLRSLETGREILNYDEYMKEFLVENSDNGRPKRSIEASRDTGVVFADLPRIVQCFLDAKQWKEMFPCLISKAATVDIICKGESSNKNGAVQLMFAELQMLTPMVPTREVYFVRYCKQLSGEKWAIVDVSIDKVEDNIDASLVKCRKRPSGCIIEDKSNGHCK
ncbi:homeobox-leucine zipper protein GLABRA 2-like, partial [Trifolium pratense]